MKKTQAEYSREWAAKNPEKVRESKRKWREKNKHKIYAQRKEYRKLHREKLDAYKRQWEKDNPELVSIQRARSRIKIMNGAFNRSYRYHYGVTLKAYNNILQLQSDVCLICGEKNVTSRSPRLVVDHDHQTGIPRALLCHRCNCGIGYFKDKPELIERAASYLRKFSEVNTDGTWEDRVKGILRSGFRPNCNV